MKSTAPSQPGAVGVLGGTFDPPHVAHLMLAEAARQQLSLGRVVFVPAGDPWRKSARKVTPASHRLAMVRLALVADPYFEVSELEIRRSGPSYSVDTLSALREEVGPGRDIYFILGEDALHDLPTWHQPARIVELARLAVARRPGAGRRGGRLLTPALEKAVPGIAGRVITVDMPLMDISATALRKRAAAGGSLRYLVPLAVDEYIRRHGLYRARPAAG